MKKLFLSAAAALMAVLCVDAQVRIESPHPDLDVKITRCAYASGTVVVDFIITNFGGEEKFEVYGSHSSATTTAYDDEGNQYTRINSELSVGLLSQGLSNSYKEMVLPQDIPMKFRVQVKNVSAQASKFPLLKVSMRSFGAMGLSKEKPILIRNLEWAK
ncbi:MAG: hypothetical protein SNH88_07735 [Rikenellaceae bacterium]